MALVLTWVYLSSHILYVLDHIIAAAFLTQQGRDVVSQFFNNITKVKVVTSILCENLFCKKTHQVEKVGKSNGTSLYSKVVSLE